MLAGLGCLGFCLNPGWRDSFQSYAPSDFRCPPRTPRAFVVTRWSARPTYRRSNVELNGGGTSKRAVCQGVDGRSGDAWRQVQPGPSLSPIQPRPTSATSPGSTRWAVRSSALALPKLRGYPTDHLKPQVHLFRSICLTLPLRLLSLRSIPKRSVGGTAIAPNQRSNPWWTRT